ncbi:unnamed protein product [Caenorhabditis angaria]|uniref:G protein-coupled receptor n=1 Tax=Caenorhabditis angaria TaxID=860376 RepID=A0A9P1IV11_9PELO|nr:unnamed protein product [Caenorhabditis angaria]
MRAEVYDCYGLDISKIAALIMVAYDSEGIRWRNMSYVIICTAVLSVQYFIIVFCGFRLHKEMNTKIFHFSPSYRKLHQQCFKALVIQVTAPTIVMFIPVCLILYLPLLNINFSLPTAALYCSITIYPALDAIIVMYNISDYRNKFTIGIKKLAGAIPLSSIGSID